MICFGIANAIAAAFTGAVAKITGRLPLMLLIMLTHGSLLFWMKYWAAVENDYISYGTMAAIWGLVDGIWLVLVNCEFLVRLNICSFKIVEETFLF